jgi:predicted nucleic acid-binding protein
LIAPDSSVVVAAFSPWHGAHAIARERLLADEVGLISHVAFETVSALSRMPEEHGASAPVVLEGLLRSFPQPWLSLNAAQMRAALERAVAAGLEGGALYDALIAATAARHGAQLLSADQRARRTYAALGADVVFIAP